MILYPNGTLYEGYFARGKRSGKGLLIDSDYEKVYIGENYNDYYHGFGKLYFLDAKII